MSRLVVYFGERGRSGGESLADRLLGLFADGGLERAVLLRGASGFGPRQGLRTSERLTLSEDLPLVAVGIGSPEKVSPVATETQELVDEGLVTLEHSALLEHDPVLQGAGPTSSSQLEITVWLDRHERIHGSPAHEGVVGILARDGADTAVSLLGIDGLAAGRRRRATFFSPNRGVPMLVRGVGPAGAIAGSWAEIRALLPDAVAEVCDVQWAEQERSKAVDASPHSGLLRLSVYSGGLGPTGGVRQQDSLLRSLRAAGADGATGYLGEFGFCRGERPHGESMFSLRRRVPAITEIVDSPGRCALWLSEMRGLAGEGALVVARSVEGLSRRGGQA